MNKITRKNVFQKIQQQIKNIITKIQINFIYPFILQNKILSFAEQMYHKSIFSYLFTAFLHFLDIDYPLNANIIFNLFDFINNFGNVMSHLIEDSLFQSIIPLRIPKNESLKILNSQKSLSFQKQNVHQQISNQIFSLQQISSFRVGQDTGLHKTQYFTLIMYKKFLSCTHFKFQGLILCKDQKFAIQYKQKRLLFGKQLMKQKCQRPIKISLNFNTGQLQILWPDILKQNQNSIINSKTRYQRTFQYVFQQMVNFLQKQLIPIFYKIQLLQEFKLHGRVYESKEGQNIDDSEQQNQNQIHKMQRYLYMSTTTDSFQKDKQTFKRIQDKALKQKQNIVKVQTSIDLIFCNINNELGLFTLNTIKVIRKKLATFGIITPFEKKSLQQCLRSQITKGKFKNQYQFVLNCIGILKIQNKKRFISSGGSCNVFLTKMVFQYIFSDDSKFWIQQNKKTSNNIIEKGFVIKQAKKGCEQKLRHENQIVKLMKGGYSIYLPKYYKIQNSSTQADRFRNQDMLIIDYLKGDSLDLYIQLNKQTLSFWTKIFLVRNIVNGLRFIAGYKIVHLDLKPNNIMVTFELLTKIIDFSDSYHPKICKQNFSPGMTLPYSCPQMLGKKPIIYDQKCDIFSLGVILFELFVQKDMFQLSKQKTAQCYKQKQYLKRIFVNPEQFESEQLAPIYNIIFQLTMRCLDPRPQYRPTINWITIIIGHVLMYFRGK